MGPFYFKINVFLSSTFLVGSALGNATDESIFELALCKQVYSLCYVTLVISFLRSRGLVCDLSKGFLFKTNEELAAEALYKCLYKTRKVNSYQSGRRYIHTYIMRNKSIQDGLLYLQFQVRNSANSFVQKYKYLHLIVFQA